VFEINEEVSWFAEGRVMVGRVIDIENHENERCYLLLENGKHPRNGFYARYADSLRSLTTTTGAWF
jgi:hypothetical protein